MHEDNPFVFVVDDDRSMRESLEKSYPLHGAECTDVCLGARVFDQPASRRPRLPGADVQLPGLSGLELQQELARGNAPHPHYFHHRTRRYPDVGASDESRGHRFLTKPFRDKDLLKAVEQAINRSRQMAPCHAHARPRDAGRGRRAPQRHNFADIVGHSAALRRVLQQVEIVAPTEATVLISGETGTGKELIARAIHQLSPRHAHAFVKLNCAAIPTGLLESELFGHEKGAFTGAVTQRIGRFELANQGTIFLDEIGELPLEVQPKLLRVLQEQEFERLGSSRTLRTDARLIAATNRDLTAMVEAQHVPGRPVLSGQRLSRAGAAAARAPGRYSAAGAPFRPAVRPPDAQNHRDHSRRHHAGVHSSIPGRATFASCKISSSGR